MTDIHPAAIVSSDARIEDDVTIGPFAVVEPSTTIGAGCRLASRVVIKRGTVLGRDNQVHEGAVLGGEPQHLQAGRRTGGVRIGNGNTIRENATIHCALEEGQNTLVGDGNLIMVNVHVAHDCRICNHAIIVNNVLLAGHTFVGDRAYVSGAVAVHQFCRIGAFAMVGGQAHIKQDVPPYVTVDGQSSLIVGLNIIGLRRNGFTDEDIQQLKSAYRVIYRSGMRWADVLGKLESQFASGPAAEFHPFLLKGKRGYVQKRRTPPTATLRVWRKASEEESELGRRAG